MRMREDLLSILYNLILAFLTPSFSFIKKCPAEVVISVAGQVVWIYHICALSGIYLTEDTGEGKDVLSLMYSEVVLL